MSTVPSPHDAVVIPFPAPRPSRPSEPSAAAPVRRRAARGRSVTGQDRHQDDGDIWEARRISVVDDNKERVSLGAHAGGLVTLTMYHARDAVNVRPCDEAGDEITRFISSSPATAAKTAPAPASGRFDNTPRPGRNLVIGNDMAGSTQGRPEGLVLLDEWHVEVFVDPELPELEADELRRRISDHLRAWADALSGRTGPSAVLRLNVRQ